LIQAVYTIGTGPIIGMRHERTIDTFIFVLFHDFQILISISGREDALT